MTPEARQAAIQHALDVFPNESVGYFKDDGYVRLTNHSKEPLEAFELSAEDSLLLQTLTYDALVHSHTNGLDHPTKLDLEVQAGMEKPWFIVVLKPQIDAPEKPVYVETFEFGDHLPPLPYENRPFRYSVTDCSKLVQDWLKQELGIVTEYKPNHFGWWHNGEDLLMKELTAQGFKRVRAQDAQRGDVVLMKIGVEVVNHIGVYLGDGMLLHHPAERPSRVSGIEVWGGCIDGYVRYSR